MTFLHLAMLTGALAVAVPILIHLLWRHRPRTVAWGAMFLIEQVLRDTSRRVAFEQRALLALRCLIMLLLALALARPVLTGCRPLTGSTPVALALVIDNSPSMNAATPGGPSTLDTARSAADRILSTLPEGSRVQLISGGQTGDERLTPAAARTRLAGLETVATPFALYDALLQAQSALQQAPHPQRQIIALSDFPASSVRSIPESATEADGTSVALLPVGAGPLANLAVESVSVSPRRPEPGRTARIVARIRNFSDRPARDLPVTLFVDEEERQEQRIDVPAGGDASVTFLHAAPQPGPLRVELVIEPTQAADALAEDNRFRLGLDVSPPPRVLLVDGSDGGLPFGQNPADFLDLAISPEQTAGAADGEEIVELIGPHELSVATLAKLSVVVLANVASLGEGQTAQLRTFVEAGGVLMVWAGESADLAWYNGWSILPAAVSDLQVRPEAVSPQGPPYAHPALGLWRDDNAALSQVEVQTHYTLQPRDAATVVLRLADGTPLAVEHTVGRGSVTLIGIPATPGWSDLPLRPAFLPLVRQLIDHAVAKATLPRTLVAGQPLALLATPAEAQRFRLRTPAGEPAALSQTLVNGTTLLQSHLQTTPGFYEVTDAQGQPHAVFAVNLDRGESDLQTLSASRLQGIAATLDADLLASVDDFARQDRQRRFGTELARPALLMLGALLVLEPFLAALLIRLRGARLSLVGSRAGEAP